MTQKLLIVFIALIPLFSLGQSDTLPERTGKWIVFRKKRPNTVQIQPKVIQPESETSPVRGCVTGSSGFNENGFNKVFNENDDLWQEGEFKNSRLWNGKVYEYDSDGILIKVLIYKEGVYHSGR